jgi:hypothetical protein
MKKTSLCIGAFLVLFLVIGVYTAQAQQDPPYPALTQMNGKWLQMSGSIKGYDFGEWKSTTAIPDKFSYTFSQQYACVSYEYDSPVINATLIVYDKEGTQIGVGNVYWESGTDDYWMPMFELSLDSGGNYVANGSDIHATLALLAKTKDGASKGSFKSFAVLGNTANDTTAVYYGGKVNAKIVDRVPFGMTCTGYVP